MENHNASIKVLQEALADFEVKVSSIKESISFLSSINTISSPVFLKQQSVEPIPDYILKERIKELLDQGIYIKIVCRALGIHENLLHNNRQAAYAKAKKICIGLLVDTQQKLTYSEMASLVKLTNHTTILYLKNNYLKLKVESKDFKVCINDAKEAILASEI